MSAQDNGGPAYPVKFKSDSGGSDPYGNEIPAGMEIQYSGLNLRDYFAAKAMQAYVARSDWSPPELSNSDEGCYELLARYSYEMADAMLEARK